MTKKIFVPIIIAILILSIVGYLTIDRELTRNLSQLIILILASLLILLGALIFFLTAQFRSVIKKITEFAEKVKNGDTQITLEWHSKDDIGQMGNALNQMISVQRMIIDHIQHAGKQLTFTTGGIEAAAKQQKVTLLNQVKTTNNVEEYIDGVSTVAIKLVETMQQMIAKLEQTAKFASHGQTDFDRLKSVMSNVESTSKSISDKLDAINEKTENITCVVTTITQVADQTNLLSLNAAIEAEKAGELGRGFNVVARAIRRLADQTAVATLDIESMVNEMQSAVATGVTEMDKFIAAVHQSSENISKINTQMNQMIEQVQALLPSFEEIKVNMTQQSQNAHHIKNVIAGMTQGMQQVVKTFEDSYHAIKLLNETTLALQDKVNQTQSWEGLAEMIKWTSDLSVNHPTIDEQHQQLFIKARALVLAIGRGNSKEEVAETINFLGNYVITHFETEEKFMIEQHYPDYAVHKAQHTKFLETFTNFKNEYQYQTNSEEQLDLILKIQKMIVDWLIYHIGGADKKLAMFLKS